QFPWLCSHCGRSTNRRCLRWCSWVRLPAPSNCWMPESVCLSVILGNALGRSLSLSSNSSWCMCFTDPCASGRKPSADRLRPHVVPVAPNCSREFREPYKQCGLTDGQNQENSHEKSQGTD